MGKVIPFGPVAPKPGKPRQIVSMEEYRYTILHESNQRVVQAELNKSFNTTPNDDRRADNNRGIKYRAEVRLPKIANLGSIATSSTLPNHLISEGLDEDGNEGRALNMSAAYVLALFSFNSWIAELPPSKREDIVRASRKPYVRPKHPQDWTASEYNPNTFTQSLGGMIAPRLAAGIARETVDLIQFGLINLSLNQPEPPETSIAALNDPLYGGRARYFSGIVNN